MHIHTRTLAHTHTHTCTRTHARTHTHTRPRRVQQYSGVDVRRSTHHGHHHSQSFGPRTALHPPSFEPSVIYPLCSSAAPAPIRRDRRHAYAQTSTVRPLLWGDDSHSLLTHSLTHSFTHSLTHSLTHSFTHLLIHSFTHSFTHYSSLTHSLTHSL